LYAGNGRKYTNGNLHSKAVGSQITFYLWDSQNRLVEVDQGSSQAGASPIALYTYDVNGNRVQKREPGQGGQPDKITAYLTDNTFAYAQTLLETTTQGNTTATTSYTWGNGLIGQNAAGQQSYAHADGLGSVKVLTNAAGNVTDTYAYDAFGNQTSRTGTTVNAYRYAGEYFDDAIQLQYNQRWLRLIGQKFAAVRWILAKVELSTAPLAAPCAGQERAARWVTRPSIYAAS